MVEESPFVTQSPLGQTSDYPEKYSPEVLFPIPRTEGRAELGSDLFDFHGVDCWTAYECSWLDTKGKPECAILEWILPCDSPNLVESKSIKLYLNSLNQTRFEDAQAYLDRVTEDLSKCSGAQVEVDFADPDIGFEAGYECLDALDVDIDCYSYNPALLKAGSDNPQTVERQWVSHLLKSNCPVTSQPDWASLYIDYAGPEIEPASLLKYIISFRTHSGFHEQCVERMFTDLYSTFKPQSLTVNARYTRRGGLDINPVRSTHEDYPIMGRTIRQ